MKCVDFYLSITLPVHFFVDSLKKCESHAIIRSKKCKSYTVIRSKKCISS